VSVADASVCVCGERQLRRSHRQCGAVDEAERQWRVLSNWQLQAIDLAIAAPPAESTLRWRAGERTNDERGLEYYHRSNNGCNNRSSDVGAARERTSSLQHSTRHLAVTYSGFQKGQGVGVIPLPFLPSLTKVI